MIDLAAAVYEQREALAAVQPRLRALRERVARPQDMAPLDWSLFYALILAFRPDRIVELGRGFGNSTAAFTQAANDLGSCAVVSVDRDIGHTWETQTLPRLNEVVEAAWLRPLQVMQADILDVSAEQMFGAAQRVILLWDAHGDQLGRYVLSELLPALQRREHLVILHDVTDARRINLERSYGAGDTATYWQGKFVCSFEEIYAALDFISRNDIEPETPSASFDSWLRANEGSEARALRTYFREVLSEAYLENGYAEGGHWLYFDLAARDSSLPLAFPPPPRRSVLARGASRALSTPAVDALLYRLSRAKSGLQARRPAKS